MDSIERLVNLFEKFPGIGPRQAGRFVHYLLRSPPALRRELIQSIQTLNGSVRHCPRCFRFHSDEKSTCVFCASVTRDNTLLAVVASDSDLLALEHSGMYRGHY